jgi:hypothetical protein
MRANWLSNRVFKSYDDLVDHLNRDGANRDYHLPKVVSTRDLSPAYR